MKALAAAALALTLCGCGQQPAADGYTFAKKEFQHETPVMQVIVHPSLADLRKTAPAAATDSIDQQHELMAYSILRPNGRCEVHVVDPAASYQPEWMGHEFAHCIWGRWHA